MDKNALEAQRRYLTDILIDITTKTQEVQAEMMQVPHKRGTARRSLKPCSGASIVSSEDGFSARYRTADGVWYEISIYARPTDPK